MIRLSNRFSSVRLVSLAALAALSLPAIQASAQENIPEAPAQATAAQVPAAPVPAATPDFPKPDPANFTAASPTKAEVDSFINSTWGYDDSRVWQVQAILKTPVEGISKVVVLVADKSGKGKVGGIQFFVLPDGKHIIAQDDILPFGAHPYTDARAKLQQLAEGPYRGSASKALELVEFADFQCPHCKDAQPTMDKLAVDFPKARIVFENFPLPQHPAAAGAAAYGVCVTKLGGSTAFFTFADAVFQGQEGLATPDGATLTLNSAVTKAGLDPAKVEACSKLPATIANVAASKKLAEDLGINETPTLMVNGRPVPASAPYEVLKKIILFQAKLDGVTAQ